MQSQYSHCTSLRYCRSCTLAAVMSKECMTPVMPRKAWLISIIVHVLRCTIAPGGRMLYVVLPHLTPVGTCILADLYRLGVNTEDSLSCIYRLGYGLTDILAKHHGFLATLVVLPTRNQVGNGSRAFRVQPLEEVVLAVNTQCLCCDGKCHHLQIGEGGNDTTSRDISLLIYLIFCK